MTTKKRQTHQSLFWEGMSRMAKGKSVKRINKKLGKIHSRTTKRKSSH